MGTTAARPASQLVIDAAAVLQRLPAAVYICDAMGVVMQFNEAGAALFGRTPALGVDTLNTLCRVFGPHGSAVAESTPMAAALLEGRASSGAALVIERADGSRRSVLAHCQPIHDEAGMLVGSVNTFVDVTPPAGALDSGAPSPAVMAPRAQDLDGPTERHRALEERREAADLLEGSIDALTSHIAILDREGVIIKVNRAWRTFGETNGFAGNHFGIGANYLEACTPHGQPATGCAMEAAYAAQGIREVIAGRVPAFVMEYPCHAPAANRWFTMRVTRFGEGDRLRIVVAHEDVTERHEAEQIIVRNAERLRLATAAANLGTWELDPDRGVLSCDQRSAELLGISGHSTDIESLRGSLFHEDRRHFYDAVKRALDPAGKGMFEVEFRFTGRRDGVHRWLRANGLAGFEHGRAVRFLGTLKDITGFKRADEAVRRSEEMLRLATDAAGIGTWTRDLSTNVVRGSPKLEELFGLPPGTFSGAESDFFHLVHPEDRDKVAAAVERAIREKSEYEVEFRFHHASGDERWMVGRGRAWYDAEGAPVLLAGTGQDISARRRAEIALRQSEEQFRTLANSMSQLAWMAAPDGGLTWYNNRWYEYTGTTFEQMQGWGWQSVHDPRELPRVVEHFKECIASGKEWEDTFPLRRHDGEMRWHLSRALPLRDEQGRIVRWFGTNTDVTAQREAEETLRASEERFRLLADSSPSMIWLSGPEPSLYWFNKAWIEFTGRSADDLAGDGWVESLHPDDRAPVVAAVDAAFDARREFRIECRLRRHDGAYRWIIDHAVPLASAGGKLTGYIGSCLDITDQVEARKTLERQQTLLEEAVRTRTAELQESNERLRLAERLASLGTLSAGLGHDMGNLLVPVRIRLQSLAGAGLGPEYMEDLEAIRTSAEYLQRLANGLRMLAVDPRRVPAGESTEVLAWWGDAGPLLKNALPRGIELVADLPGTPCHVGVSRPALTQAVFNLVQNAGDAMRVRGKGKVTVAVQAQGDRVRLSVSDNGPGMTPEVRARCMEPFFTTKPRGISTGLGLLLVYGIVREAGGTVELHSEVGAGTTFMLSLPVPAPPTARAAGRHAVVRVGDPRLRGLVTGELKALGVAVSTDVTPGATADILVADQPDGAASAGHASIVLLADKAPGVPENALTIGPRPKLSALREALHAVVKGGGQ